jgi:hypothetical protein
MNEILISVVLMTNVAQPITQSDYKATRIQRSATFQVQTSVENAFPLFGPIREKEWAAGWDPEIIYSLSSEVEEHMVFRTKASMSDAASYLWIITTYRPDDNLIEYTVSTPKRIWFINVKCRPNNLKTDVTVTYTFTGLTEEGHNVNQLAMEKMYANNLKDWEEEINFYLSTGKQLIR